MNYRFVSDVNQKEYDEFIKNYDCVSFMQESGWAVVKENWSHLFCGVYQDKTLVAVALVLIRTFSKHVQMFYIPRGYVCDFTNFELLSFFTSEIKKLAKQHHAYVVKIDPNLCVTEKTWKEIQNKESEDHPIYFSKNYNVIHQNLLHLGYHHKGFYKSIDSAFQPRYQMACPLVDSKFNHLTIDEVISSYKSKVRYYLGDFHEKRGVSFEVTHDKARIKDFMSILDYTEKRQNINLRNQAYFERILEEYKERAILLFGYIDMHKYIEYLKKNKGKGIEEAVQLQEQKGNKILMSASLVLLPVNKKGIRISEYLYAGNNLLYPNLRISTGMVYEILKLSIEHNCDYCNLGGIEGTLDDHLTEFKSKFNPTIFEYMGEYDLKVNSILYIVISHGEKPLKKLYHKISKILKK